MRHLDAFPRFLLKLPFIVRLSVAILSVAFFLILYMMVSPAARTPLMLAIPVALVAWMFRKRGVFICLASMVLVLWVYYSLRMKSILLSSSMIISSFLPHPASAVIGWLLALLVNWSMVLVKLGQQRHRVFERSRHLIGQKDRFI